VHGWRQDEATSTTASTRPSQDGAALVRENVLGRVFVRLVKATYFGQSVPTMTSTSRVATAAHT